MSTHPASRPVTPDRPSTVVRLSGPQGLALAVPQHLGFHPERSLVLLCLTAPRGRVGPVARIDLYDPSATDPTDQLVGCASRYADSAAVLCYHDGPRPACLDALLDALEEAGIAVTDVLSISDGVIRQARTARQQRDDPGTPLPDADDPQAQRLAAAAALAGRRTLPSRAALARSIAAPRAAMARTVRDALIAARGAGRDAGAGSPSPVTARDVAAHLIDDALDQQADGGDVQPSTAAELIAFCDTVTGRDLLIAESVGRDDPDTVPMLISVAGLTPDEDAPGLCSVLAVAAYRFGDGALAHCALDRVLAHEPDHRLAHLLIAAIAAALPPQALAEMATIGRSDDGDEVWDEQWDQDCDADVRGARNRPAV